MDKLFIYEFHQAYQKLAEVEAYFKKNAPWFLKLLFAISGQDNLKDLIEEALSQVKEGFGNSSKE